MPDFSPDSRGIRYWMHQVVAEAGKAREGLAADPVHDLRVAIRRCRSIGEGFVAIDPEPAWKKMRRYARPLFSALGDLRDVQVQMEWVEKLGVPDDPVTKKLMDHFHSREDELKAVAADALAAFDTRQWETWADLLDERSQKIPPGGEAFLIMALERWQAARDLQTAALRTRGKVALHSLRIGLKKLRYIVENFLPEQHDAWMKDLKKLQDLLGDIHDLDVLWETARTIRAFITPQQREHWLAVQKRERQQRLDSYRAKMSGRDSLWYRWRAQLPQGEALQLAIRRYFETWAFLRDPDLSHTHRVLQSSLAIFDAALESRLIRVREFAAVPLRELLAVAALTHTSAEGGHHKRIVKELHKLAPPPGWSALHLQVVGLAARYHVGALPAMKHAAYARLRQSGKNAVHLLGGILRLAEAFDSTHDGRIPEIAAGFREGVFVISASGYQERIKHAERISAARHLLETVLRRPVVVRAPEEPKPAPRSPAASPGTSPRRSAP